MLLSDGMRDGVVDGQRSGRAVHLRLSRHSSSPRLHGTTSGHRQPGGPSVHVGRRNAVGAALSPNAVPRPRHQRDRLRGPTDRVRLLAAVRRRLHVDAQPAAVDRSARRSRGIQRPHRPRAAYGGNAEERRRRWRRQRRQATATPRRQEPQRDGDAGRRRGRLRRLHSAGRRHVGLVRRRVRGRTRPAGEGSARVQRRAADALFRRQLRHLLPLQQPVPRCPLRRTLPTQTGATSRRTLTSCTGGRHNMPRPLQVDL